MLVYPLPFHFSLCFFYLIFFYHFHSIPFFYPLPSQSPLCFKMVCSKEDTLITLSLSLQITESQQQSKWTAFHCNRLMYYVIIRFSISFSSAWSFSSTSLSHHDGHPPELLLGIVHRRLGVQLQNLKRIEIPVTEKGFKIFTFMHKYNTSF